MSSLQGAELSLSSSPPTKESSARLLFLLDSHADVQAQYWLTTAFLTGQQANRVVALY